MSIFRTKKACVFERFLCDFSVENQQLFNAFARRLLQHCKTHPIDPNVYKQRIVSLPISVSANSIIWNCANG